MRLRLLRQVIELENSNRPESPCSEWLNDDYQPALPQIAEK